MNIASCQWVAKVTLPFAGLSLAGLLAVGPAAAQATNGVEGRVVTDSGQAVAAAIVSVRGTGREVVTDADGRFRLDGLPAGRFVLEARRIGYRPHRVTVEVPFSGRLTLQLVAAPVTVDDLEVRVALEEDARTHELSELLHVPPVGTANVTTVTSPEIRDVNASDPWALVRETTGLEIHEQGQGPGFASDAVIRGFTSDHSSDVALIVDGVPVNEPVNGHGEGFADWNIVFPSAISDIQVIKGPISPLFGNFAVGGAVNVTTRAASDRTDLVVEGGSFEQGRVALSTGLDREPWGMHLAGDLSRSGGWRQNSNFRIGHLVARANRRLGRTLTLDGAAHVYGTDWDSPGYVSVTDFNAGLVNAATDSTDGGSKTSYLGRLAANVVTSAVDWTTLVWGMHADWELFLNIPELGGDGEGIGTQSEERDVRDAVGVRSIARIRAGRTDFVVGVEGQRHSATYDRYATLARVRQGPLDLLTADQTTLAAFAGGSATLGRRWRVEGGLRADRVRTNSRDRQLDVVLPTRTHQLLSPKLGVVFYPRGDFQLYGSLARGFRTAAGTIGTPSLDPVSVWDTEVGARYVASSVDLSASLFRLVTRHERLFNPITRQVESDGESDREGIEVDFGYRPADHLEFITHWTLNTRGRFFLPDTAGASAGTVPLLHVASGGGGETAAYHPEGQTGEHVPGVADFVGRLGVAIDVGPSLGLHAWTTVTGPYVPVGEPDVEARTYALVNFRGSYRISRTLEVNAGVSNILDARAAEVRASGFINPAAPRALHVTFTTHLR